MILVVGSQQAFHSWQKENPSMRGGAKRVWDDGDCRGFEATGVVMLHDGHHAPVDPDRLKACVRGNGNLITDGGSGSLADCCIAVDTPTETPAHASVGINEIREWCLEFDRHQGPHPEHEYEGLALFTFFSAKFNGDVFVDGDLLSGPLQHEWADLVGEEGA